MPATVFAPAFEPIPYWWDASSTQDHIGDALPDAAEVAIVGSGYAGLCCAIELAGADVAVIEAWRPAELDL